MRPTPLKILMKLVGETTESTQLIHGGAIDSRLVKPGDLFFALKGERHDGHDHLQQAALRNSAAAIVDKSYQGPSHGLDLIFVDDVKAILQSLAKILLSKQNAQVIAITGTMGKTTTKEFAKTLIGSTYRTYATPLSYNSQVTVPLSILNAKGDEEVLILEMGMSEPGNIANLIDIAPPDIALITNVAMQHAENFDDGLEGIAKEKGSIFSHPKTRLGIYFDSMPFASQVAQIGTCEKKTFSTEHMEADFFLQRNGELLDIHEKGEESYAIPVTFPMKAYDHNFLAALTLARLLDIPWPVIKEAAQFIKVPPMRFEIIEQMGITFINDAYNANPDAILAAFESLPKPKKGGRVIAVLSEMDALGSYVQEGHRQVGKAALNAVDCLFCIGNHCAIMQEIWEAEAKPFKLFSSLDDLQHHLTSYVKAGDVVLVKGARSYGLEKIIQTEHNKRHAT